MHLDLDGNGALYAQLLRALKRAILDRRLVPGAQLPATRELAAELGVSRNTVLGAYEQLLAEGFIEARQGSGSYVAELLSPRQAPAPETSNARAPRLAQYARVAAEERAHLPPGRLRKRLRYNLEYGLPLVTPALQSQWRRAISRAADDTELDYPPAEGLASLRSAIAGYLGRRRGLVVDPEDVLVCAGVQQVLDLSLRALVQPGDRVAIEDPGYQGTRQALRAAGARIEFVPVDAEGLVTSKLPRRGARMLCVTPSHQFPRGAVLALRRRFELLDWASHHDTWVIEDDYDGEFRHDGRPLAALKSLDRDGRVIYAGTFSKVMFPALRLGYLVAPPSLREPLRACKWLADRGCPAIEQHALADLIDSGRFERLLRQGGRLLAERRKALLDTMERHAEGLVEFEGTSAGMHVAAWLPRHRIGDVGAVIEAAEQVQVGAYPMSPYFQRVPERAGLLLGYSGLSARGVAEGAKRLAAVLRRTAR